MQVVVNGDIKGTVHVPRHDPSYFVTVNESTQSIEFVSLSGTVNISSIKVVGSQNSYTSSKPWQTGVTYSSGLYGYNKGTLAQEIALNAIDMVTEFSKYSSYKELGDFLLPIKKASAKVYAISYGAGDYSVRMRESLINLSTQLHFANNFINENFEKTALFDLAVSRLIRKYFFIFPKIVGTHLSAVLSKTILLNRKQKGVLYVVSWSGLIKKAYKKNKSGYYNSRGRVLKKLREDCKLSMREAGYRFMKSDSYISHIENGRLDIPKEEALQKFLGIYGVASVKSFYQQVDDYKKTEFKKEKLINLINKMDKENFDSLLCILEGIATKEELCFQGVK